MKTIKYISFLLMLLTFTLFILINCGTTKKEQSTMYYDKNNLIQLSPITQKFLEEFDKEISKFNETDNFIPSDNMMKKYPVFKKDSQYFISGLIKIEDFSGDVDLPNVIINTKAGNIYTVIIPLNQFHNIIVNKNIKYLQIDEKVNRK